ncbi:hypothetical protein PTTW11_08423 [Pyrenophora teres f. teres]|uniref:Uncharacterized protein n=1 Tax=Pyrenophora teres f. teres TaxID=97479 RepID=A0A6S6W837_9PLEO|nr:hypothetical protein PTTW11_08423 [Pyrenophora teres f. teres]
MYMTRIQTSTFDSENTIVGSWEKPKDYRRKLVSVDLSQPPVKPRKSNKKTGKAYGAEEETRSDSELETSTNTLDSEDDGIKTCRLSKDIIGKASLSTWADMPMNKPIGGLLHERATIWGVHAAAGHVTPCARSNRSQADDRLVRWHVRRHRRLLTHLPQESKVKKAQESCPGVVFTA